MGIKKCKSIIKKKKKHNKTVLLAKSKLNRIEVLTYKTLIDLNISHGEFVLIKEYNVFKEYNEMKEETNPCFGLTTSGSDIKSKNIPKQRVSWTITQTSY